MNQFFPGSRQPLSGPPGLPPDPLGGLTGKTFTITGKEVELFTISQLGEALNRTPGAIRKWERLGVIPKATYVKPGANQDPRGKRRLYSREQVEALRQIAQEEGILFDPHKRIGTTRFQARALAAFKEIAKR